MESGWVSLLENKLKNQFPKSTVINSSISGDTTANALTRLPTLLKEYKPDIVIIELGGNDGLRGYPIQSIKTNLMRLIELSLDKDAKVLLVAIKLPPNYGPVYTKQFFEIYSELSKKQNVSMAPFILENIASKMTMMQADHIHPTEKAQPIILENIWPHLKPLLTEWE